MTAPDPTTTEALAGFKADPSPELLWQILDDCPPDDVAYVRREVAPLMRFKRKQGRKVGSTDGAFKGLAAVVAEVYAMVDASNGTIKRPAAIRAKAEEHNINCRSLHDAVYGQNESVCRLLPHIFRRPNSP